VARRGFTAVNRAVFGARQMNWAGCVAIMSQCGKVEEELERLTTVNGADPIVRVEWTSYEVVKVSREQD
jgi:hypothetical protein